MKLIKAFLHLAIRPLNLTALGVS